MQFYVMNKIHEQLPPGRIYGFDPKPYKEIMESVALAQLECYKALLVFSIFCPTLHQRVYEDALAETRYP
jgi:hypothetical protein